MRGFGIRCLSIALCALITSGAAHAKDPAEHLYKPDPAYPPQPAMFVLRDHDSSVYLFGSVHLLQKGTKWRTPLFNESLAHADTLWLEATFLDMTNPALLREYYKSGYDMHGNLTKRMTPEQRKDLEDLMSDIGMQMADIDHLQPWAAADVIESEFYTARANNKHIETDPNKKYKRRKIIQGVEMILEKGGLGIPTKSLEPTRENMLKHSTLSESDQMAYLMNTVNDLRGEISIEQDSKMDQLFKAWVTGDLNDVHTSGNKDMQEKTPGLYNMMLTTRNQQMTDAIIRELNGTGTDFVVVGAGHLAGPDSVLRMLVEKGYKPERLYDTHEPEISSTKRKFFDPGYKQGKIYPKKLDVSLRPSKGDRADEVILRLSTPLNYQICGDISPLNHWVKEEQGALTIYVGPYYITQYPTAKNDDCGTPIKAASLDIPLALDDLVGDKPRILQMMAPGLMDSYKVTLSDNTLLFEPMGPLSFFKPLNGQDLRLDLQNPAH
ncbi:TraB/GumN family protein [Micavibrio aeruginosavorus]|uniref:TraB/GumN family protein n=1 Tax=Micavibrio aeruginosavorus TaxID=349221 RepID=UPI003F4ADC31